MVNPKDINYIMLRLNGKCKSKLIQITEKLFGDKYQNIYCDHITLAYGPQEVSKFDLRLLDKKVEIDANTIRYDNNAAAIAIDRNDVLPYGINNKYPHITLATSTNVRPVYSNTLMKNFFEIGHGSRQYMFDEPIKLNFTIVPHINQSKYM